MIQKRLVDADYVRESLDVSRATAYRIIRDLTTELEASGIRTIPGKINLAFFEEKYFALPGEGGVSDVR